VTITNTNNIITLIRSVRSEAIQIRNDVRGGTGIKKPVTGRRSGGLSKVDLR
jgi:hypothetical protein